MKRVVFALVAALALCLSSSAQADVVVVSYDVTGIESWDSLGDSDNVLASVDLGAYTGITVTGIGWDVDLSATGPSWLSELTVGFLDSPIGLQLAPGAGDTFPGAATYSSGGILDLATIDPSFPFTVPGNTVSLEFFEGFDDFADGIDGMWTGGTLTFQFSGTPVPEPSALGLLAVAGVGFVARRRR